MPEALWDSARYLILVNPQYDQLGRGISILYESLQVERNAVSRAMCDRGGEEGRRDVSGAEVGNEIECERHIYSLWRLT